MKKHERVEGLDALRGIAASAIVVLHASYIHDIGIPQSVFVKFFAMGVPLFFIISAFSMSFRYRAGFSARGSLMDFAIRRIARIAPLFYVMIAAWLGYLWWMEFPRPGIEKILLSITFLFSLTPGSQTSIVPAGWSIGIEMLFYAAFPLLIRMRSILVCTIVIILLIIVYTFFSTLVTEPRAYFYLTHPVTNAPYFIFGILAYRIYDEIPDDSSDFLANIFFLLGAFGVAVAVALHPKIAAETAMFTPPNPTSIGLWGASFMALVLSQALKPSSFLVNRSTLFLGLVSYSVYLVHPLLIHASPLTPFLKSWEVAWQLKVATAGSIALAASVIVGTVLYRLVEVPGQLIGKRLASRHKAMVKNVDAGGISAPHAASGGATTSD